MKLTDKISIKDFKYELPEAMIAKYPLAERDNSRLLIYNSSKIIQHDRFINLKNYLPSDSLLVFNNTRVIYARLFFIKPTGAIIELFCLKPLIPADYAQVFQTTESCNWECIIGNSKRWKSECLVRDLFINGKNLKLSAKKISRISEDGSWNIEFSWDDNNITFAEILENTGRIPIPPYLKRDAEESDIINYQTVYAKNKGSVAAPTAGLHFTDRVFESLKNNGIKTAEITLHIGAGTFQPVKADNIENHLMHAEEIMLNERVINNLLDNIDNIIAVGTTSVRTLESIYWLGVKISRGYLPETGNPVIGQWECYQLQQDLPPEKALLLVRDHLRKSGKPHMEISTRIIIVPGYEFKMIQGMITNFHQPKSTLLLLIAAFVGEAWKDIYSSALKNDFRFLSYGDCSLLMR